MKVMNNVKLIDCVKSNPCLYDLSHQQYADIKSKENIWLEIGRELRQPGSACKSRWHNVRDQFRKSILKNQAALNGEGKEVKRYKYEQNLAFLLPFLKERGENRVTNIEIDIDPQWTANVEDDTNSSYGGKITSSDATIERTSKSLSRFLDTPSFSNKKYKKMRQNELSSPTIVTYVPEDSVMEAPSLDPIEAFLAGIGTTLRTFKPYYLNIAKTKIFTAVQEIEMTQILENDTARKQEKTFLTLNSSNTSDSIICNVQSSDTITVMDSATHTSTVHSGEIPLTQVKDHQ